MSVDKDVQRRDLNFNGFKGEGIAAATNPGDVPRFDQLLGADMMSMSKDEQVAVLLSAAETIVAEFVADFAEMSSANITGDLAAALAMTAGAGTTTARLYTGASAIGVIDGALRATIGPSGAAAFTPLANRGGAFAKPAGVTIVQITLQNSGAGVSGAILGAVVNFRGA